MLHGPGSQTTAVETVVSYGLVASPLRCVGVFYSFSVRSAIRAAPRKKVNL